MEYSIRDAQTDDLPMIEEIEKECFSVPWTRSQLALALPGKEREFLVAADPEGAILGYAALMTVLDEGSLSNIAVTGKARRHRIAHALLDEMLLRAKQRRLSFVTLEVRAQNSAAISLYEKAGFAPVGLIKAYYEFPKEDALLMTIFFDEEEHADEDPSS